MTEMFHSRKKRCYLNNMKNISFLLSLFLLLNTLNAQDTDSLRKVLEIKFQSFEYQAAVDIANILLEKKDEFTKEDQLEILRIKSVALYNLAEEDSARNVFIQILKIENTFFLDPVKNSPKIVEFFNNIKSSIKGMTSPDSNAEKKINDNNLVPENPAIITKTNAYDMRDIIGKSIILPGWGHLSGGKKGKGWLIGSAGLISLGSSIYFLIDCNRKEKDYLTETNLFLIEDKYKSYNNSYKIRNISIAAYIAVWIYSQIDLLYISDFEFETGQVSTNSQITSLSNIRFSYKLNF